MIDMIGLISEFPTRLLMTSDELFKQLNYRGRLYANAVENIRAWFKLWIKRR